VDQRRARMRRRPSDQARGTGFGRHGPNPSEAICLRRRKSMPGQIMSAHGLSMRAHQTASFAGSRELGVSLRACQASGLEWNRRFQDTNFGRMMRAGLLQRGSKT
jgi:hypothetical protein